MKQSGRPGRPRQRGHAIVELSLMVPWLFFLFVGAFDFGFYAYSLIAVQNAARVAALYAGTTETPSPAFACFYASEELSRMPNSQFFLPDCSDLPLKVSVTPFTDAEGRKAFQVQVTYQTIQLIPIPGLLTGKLTFSRVADIKVYGNT